VKPIVVDVAAEEFEAAKGAHTGKQGAKKLDEEEPPTLEGLLAQGFKHVKWDGV
jgi:hypothetical protein